MVARERSTTCTKELDTARNETERVLMRPLDPHIHDSRLYRAKKRVLRTIHALIVSSCCLHSCCMHNSSWFTFGVYTSRKGRKREGEKREGRKREWRKREGEKRDVRKREGRKREGCGKNMLDVCMFLRRMMSTLQWSTPETNVSPQPPCRSTVTLLL